MLKHLFHTYCEISQELNKHCYYIVTIEYRLKTRSIKIFITYKCVFSPFYSATNGPGKCDLNIEFKGELFLRKTAIKHLKFVLLKL